MKATTTPPANQYSLVKVQHIDPINEFIKPKIENEGSLGYKVSPSVNGVAAGEINYGNKKTITLEDLKWPYVVGTGSGKMTGEDGIVKLTWTYYPEKYQPIITGDKTTYAFIDVERPVNTTDMQLVLVPEVSYCIRILGVNGLRFSPLDNMKFENVKRFNLSSPAKYTVTALNLNKSNLPENVDKYIKEYKEKSKDLKTVNEEKTQKTTTPDKLTESTVKNTYTYEISK